MYRAFIDKEIKFCHEESWGWKSFWAVCVFLRFLQSVNTQQSNTQCQHTPVEAQYLQTNLPRG